MQALNLKQLSVRELEAALAPHGGTPVAALKVFSQVFHRGARDVAQVLAAPQLPRTAREFLAQAAELPRLEVVERRAASDGFVKYLFASPLGGRVEAVRIPLFVPGKAPKYVVCISSQVGCALACDFCATGRMGFKRNLKAWEMLDQVLQVRAEADAPVRGAVFMGMGEPLLNYAEVLKAASTLCHPAGLQIAAKSITLSTAGTVPAIRRYVADGPPYRLAFSVTSAIPEKRAVVLPIEKAHPLPTLVDAIREYTEVRKERALVAYVAIRGFNTGREDALALAEAFRGIPITIDLIDVTDPTGKYLPPTDDELRAFRDHLQVVGAPIARRYSGGKDIGAACGTLEASQYGGEVLALRPEGRLPTVAGPAGNAPAPRADG